MMLNADWIQCIEETPDTLITLTTGVQFFVRNRADEVVSLFMDYRKSTQYIAKLPKENT